MHSLEYSTQFKKDFTRKGIPTNAREGDANAGSV
jgi:mRNA-degrading endonuclease YafQ of YafQ-DinJ toxin-antitoxin module